MNYLIKDFTTDIKEVNVKKRIVKGYFSAFGNEDSDGDIIMPGAFKKTIQERGANGTNQIMHLLQHDSWKPLSKPTVLNEDYIGLYFESSIADTTYGSDTLKLYEAGVYNEHSIGYRVVKSEQKRDNSGNLINTELLELFLYEGSTVTWGANSNTPFLGFKSKNKKELNNDAVKRIEKINKAFKVGTLTDDTYKSMELALIQLETIIKTLNEPEKSTNEPFNAIEYLKNNLKF